MSGSGKKLNPEAYLQLLQERNRLKKKLNEKTPEEVLNEQRERGFVTQYRGANEKKASSAVSSGVHSSPSVVSVGEKKNSGSRSNSNLRANLDRNGGGSGADVGSGNISGVPPTHTPRKSKKKWGNPPSSDGDKKLNPEMGVFFGVPIPIAPAAGCSKATKKPICMNSANKKPQSTPDRIPHNSIQAHQGRGEWLPDDEEEDEEGNDQTTHDLREVEKEAPKLFGEPLPDPNLERLASSSCLAATPQTLGNSQASDNEMKESNLQDGVDDIEYDDDFELDNDSSSETERKTLVGQSCKQPVSTISEHLDVAESLEFQSEAEKPDESSMIIDDNLASCLTSNANGPSRYSGCDDSNPGTTNAPLKSPAINKNPSFGAKPVYEKHDSGIWPQQGRLGVDMHASVSFSASSAREMENFVKEYNKYSYQHPDPPAEEPLGVVVPLHLRIRICSNWNRDIGSGAEEDKSTAGLSLKQIAIRYSDKISNAGGYVDISQCMWQLYSGVLPVATSHANPAMAAASKTLSKLYVATSTGKSIASFLSDTNAGNHWKGVLEPNKFLEIVVSGNILVSKSVVEQNQSDSIAENYRSLELCLWNSRNESLAVKDIEVYLSPNGVNNTKKADAFWWKGQLSVSKTNSGAMHSGILSIPMSKLLPTPILARSPTRSHAHSSASPSKPSPVSQWNSSPSRVKIKDLLLNSPTSPKRPKSSHTQGQALSPHEGQSRNTAICPPHPSQRLSPQGSTHKFPTLQDEDNILKAMGVRLEEGGSASKAILESPQCVEVQVDSKHECNSHGNIEPKKLTLPFPTQSVDPVVIPDLHIDKNEGARVDPEPNARKPSWLDDVVLPRNGSSGLVSRQVSHAVDGDANNFVMSPSFKKFKASRPALTLTKRRRARDVDPQELSATESDRAPSAVVAPVSENRSTIGEYKAPRGRRKRESNVPDTIKLIPENSEEPRLNMKRSGMGRRSRAVVQEDQQLRESYEALKKSDKFNNLSRILNNSDEFDVDSTCQHPASLPANPNVNRIGSDIDFSAPETPPRVSSRPCSANYSDVTSNPLTTPAALVRGSRSTEKRYGKEPKQMQPSSTDPVRRVWDPDSHVSTVDIEGSAGESTIEVFTEAIAPVEMAMQDSYVPSGAVSGSVKPCESDSKAEGQQDVVEEFSYVPSGAVSGSVKPCESDSKAEGQQDVEKFEPEDSVAPVEPSGDKDAVDEVESPSAVKSALHGRRLKLNKNKLLAVQGTVQSLVSNLIDIKMLNTESPRKGRSSNAVPKKDLGGECAQSCLTICMYLYSNWGDSHYIGLNGFELFDCHGKLIPYLWDEGAEEMHSCSSRENTPKSDGSGNGVVAFDADVGSSFEKLSVKLAPVQSNLYYISSITTTANAVKNDPRVVENLLDGHNYTTSELHVWQTPIRQSKLRSKTKPEDGCGDSDENAPIAVITMKIKSKSVAYSASGDDPVPLSLNCVSIMRVWNYNTSRTHSYKGVQKCVVTGNGERVFEGSLCKAPGILTCSASASFSVSTNRSHLHSGLTAAMDSGDRKLDAEQYYQAIALNSSVVGVAEGLEDNILKYDKLMGYLADEGDVAGDERVHRVHKQSALTVEAMLNSGIDARSSESLKNMEFNDTMGSGEPLELMEERPMTADSMDAPLFDKYPLNSIQDSPVEPDNSFEPIKSNSLPCTTGAAVYSSPDAAACGVMSPEEMTETQLPDPSPTHQRVNLDSIKETRHEASKPEDVEYDIMKVLMEMESDFQSPMPERTLFQQQPQLRDEPLPRNVSGHQPINSCIHVDEGDLIVCENISLVVESTWGDAEYVGLAGVEVLEGRDCVVAELDMGIQCTETPQDAKEYLTERLSAQPRDLSEIGMFGDPRVPENLLLSSIATTVHSLYCKDSVSNKKYTPMINYNTTQDKNMWLIPFTQGAEHTFTINVSKITNTSKTLIASSGLNIWNYNKVGEGVFRGVKTVSIYADMHFVGRVTLRPAPGVDGVRFHQTILWKDLRNANSGFYSQHDESPIVSGSSLRYITPPVKQDYQVNYHLEPPHDDKTPAKTGTAPTSGAAWKFTFLTNHNDDYYIGLDCIEMFDLEGKQIDIRNNAVISAVPHSLHDLYTPFVGNADSGSGADAEVLLIQGKKMQRVRDKRIPENLFRHSEKPGDSSTSKSWDFSMDPTDSSCWLSPIVCSMTELERQSICKEVSSTSSFDSLFSDGDICPKHQHNTPMNNTLYVMFHVPVSVSLIRFYNYSKNPLRGVNEMMIELDQQLLYVGSIPIFNPEVHENRKTTYREPCQSIIFSHNSKLIARERPYVHYSGSSEQDVICINNRMVMAKSKSMYNKKGSNPMAEGVRVDVTKRPGTAAVTK